MTDSPTGDDGGRRPIKRALVSVYDKTDLLVVAEALVEAGAEIVSTGSTAERIAEAGLPVTPIEKVTGFPECLDGRVKTLHPMVHAGLLADVRLESHRAQISEIGVEPFDLLISNLYPSPRRWLPAPLLRPASSRSTSAARRWCAARQRTMPRWL